jgi:hypothetical protein
MVAHAQFLRPDRPVDLPLVMLPGLAEHGEEHEDLIDPLEVAVAETVEPVTDLRLKLEALSAKLS